MNAKKGISSRELARDIKVTKDTAWFMLMRIRKAMTEYGKLLEGIIEADETYIGGKNKNKHKSKRKGQLDEFCFRYNNRKNKNIFSIILKRDLNL